jgi:hypothetical protein
VSAVSIQRNHRKTDAKRQEEPRRNEICARSGSPMHVGEQRWLG